MPELLHSLMSQHEDNGNQPGDDVSARRGRRWCFTLNNPSGLQEENLRSSFEALSGTWIIGREIGESGTPHLQGYVEFANATRFSTLKSVDGGIHWELAKGSRRSNIVYCSKDGDWDSNFTRLPMRLRLLRKYKTVEWREWQQRVIDVVEGEVDERRVYWFWEPAGGAGKSFLAKYLYLKYNAIIAEGKRADVFNQVRMFMDKNKDEGPGLVLLDIPRSSKDYFNYGTVESLKNGLCYSGKYEGGVCCFETPHVIIFANFPPEYHQLSLDRWWVLDIVTGEQRVDMHRAFE